MVTVLYNMAIAESETIQSLLRQDSLADCHVIIYDNGTIDQHADVPANMSYHYDGKNKGLAAVYNQVLATLQPDDWIVLLDQDTHVTRDYVDTLKETIQQDFADVIVPIIKDNGVQISPVYMKHNRVTHVVESGLYQHGVMAINSASAYRVKTLRQIGKFDERFPVDYLDHSTFYKLSQHGVNIQVLSITLQHALSVMHYPNVSIERYRQLLQSETLFMKVYKLESFNQYKKQLFLRMCKQLLKYPTHTFWYETCKQLLKLFGDKRSR